jgi:hypothetical protein
MNAMKTLTINPEVMRTVLIERITDKLHADGYQGYIQCNLGEALEVARYDGSILDLDRILILQSILGFNVSYELYAMIDASYDDIDILEFTEEDKPELMELVNRISF